MLNSILSKALQYSLHGDTDLAGNFTFALRFLPETFHPHAPDSLNCLELRYKVRLCNGACTCAWVCSSQRERLSHSSCQSLFDGMLDWGWIILNGMHTDKLLHILFYLYLLYFSLSFLSPPPLSHRFPITILSPSLSSSLHSHIPPPLPSPFTCFCQLPFHLLVSVFLPLCLLPGGLAAEHHHHRQLHEQVQPSVLVPVTAQTHGVEPP